MQEEDEPSLVAFAQPDLTRAEPLPAVIACLPFTSPSEIEREVLTLFDMYRNRLLAYSMAFGVSGHDSEEVVQEVFLALFRHLRLGKSKRNLRAWMFRVAHNLALKQRNLNRRSRIEPDPTLLQTQSDPSPNPEEQALSAQRQRCLLAVVGALPKQDQCCLRLRAEGLRYREIAQVLDISLGAVSISLTRSLARLMRADGV
jgi:RNA polymerase sigma-70 factor, ECF subfamily